MKVPPPAAGANEFDACGHRLHSSRSRSALNTFCCSRSTPPSRNREASIHTADGSPAGCRWRCRKPCRKGLRKPSNTREDLSAKTGIIRALCTRRSARRREDDQAIQMAWRRRCRPTNYTDLVLEADHCVFVHKVPSTPHDQSEGVLKGLRELCEISGVRPHECIPDRARDDDRHQYNHRA